MTAITAIKVEGGLCCREGKRLSFDVVSIRKFVAKFLYKNKKNFFIYVSQILWRFQNKFPETKMHSENKQQKVATKFMTQKTRKQLKVYWMFAVVFFRKTYFLVQVFKIRCSRRSCHRRPTVIIWFCYRNNFLRKLNFNI